ncbi:MAG: hypothetical protein M0P71_09965 [Melioribacteraceae bacterium]|nr:hypothetical protein [Melioribacteraceae bacterium]
MKKIIIIFLFTFVSSIYSQFDFTLGMGLDFNSTSSFREYINSNYSRGSSDIATFKSSVFFSGEVGYDIKENIQLAIEYNVLIDSYTQSIGVAGNYEMSYVSHRPSIIAYYVLKGKGYKFKFGGGAGFRYVQLDEKKYIITNYSTNGYGIVLKAEGNTLLSGNFYANIGVSLRYDTPGAPKNSLIGYIYNPITKENLNLNSVSVGIKIGVSYSI